MAETGYKAGAESQLQEDGQGEAEDIIERLDHFEAEIRRNEERLREIAEEKRRHADTSEEYARLEDERRSLRKELVDYDY